MELRSLLGKIMRFVSSDGVPRTPDGQLCPIFSLRSQRDYHIICPALRVRQYPQTLRRVPSGGTCLTGGLGKMPQIQGHSSHIPPVPPTQQTMDQHIHSLAEAMLATTVGDSRNSLILPIIDILDEVRTRSPGRARRTHHRAFRCPHPQPQTNF